ncbi:hypothetical protein BCR44DRAFT_53702 [Catenaria anguillulae PL171]|uniref:Uncharacterized protein n=1 Tax=Catenaria anguillulae PL171 TaxID=765915 RepID=A0A1Y2HKA4_9FUNG|nr:hypothetical protein BCR44DRAFT_53702 [Catenaria anguillulae PL171]
MFKEQVRKFQAVAVKSLSKQVKQTIKKHLSENPKGDIKKLVKEELIKFKTTTAKALVQKAKGAIKRLAHQTLPKLKRKLQAKYAKLKTQAVKGIKDRISKLKRFKNTTLRRLKRNAKRLIQRAKGLFRKQVHGSQSKANTTLSTSTSSGHQQPCSIDQALIRLRMAKLWSVMYDVERSAAIRARHSVNAALNSISSIHSQLTARYNTTAQPHNAAIERSAKATPRIGWTTTAVQSDVVPAHKPTANATSSEIQAVRSTGIASTSSELSLPTRTTPVVIPTTDGAAA